MLLMQMVIYQSSSPKIPGWQILIRFRVDGNQFTTPLISLFSGCYVVLQMCILKKTSHLKSSYSASWSIIVGEQFCNYISLLFYMSNVTDPNISAYCSKSSFYCGYGTNILCHSHYEQMNCLKKILIEL